GEGDPAIPVTTPALALGNREPRPDDDRKPPLPKNEPSWAGREEGCCRPQIMDNGQLDLLLDTNKAVGGMNCAAGDSGPPDHLHVVFQDGRPCGGAVEFLGRPRQLLPSDRSADQLLRRIRAREG